MNEIALHGSFIFILVGVLLLITIQFDSQRLVDLLSKSLLVVGSVGTFVSLLTKRFLGKERANRLFTNLAISVITLIFFLVASEFCLRFYLRDISKNGATESYLAHRWRNTEIINAWEFRERNFNPIKPEGVYRIAVIGDSITYGQGVLESDRFTNLLEARLNNGKENYQVLNFGRRGAETVHHLQLLENPVLRLDPDFVLLQWYINDVEGEDKSRRPDPIVLIPNELRENSAFLSMFHDLSISLQEKLGLVETYEEYMIERFGDPLNSDSLDSVNALREFVYLCRQHGLSVGIVIFNQYHSQGNTLDFLINRVLEVCGEEAITCIDLRDVFAPYKGGRKLWANWGDMHPSPFAHGLVTDALMETFGEVWLSRQVITKP